MQQVFLVFSTNFVLLLLVEFMGKSGSGFHSSESQCKYTKEGGEYRGTMKTTVTEKTCIKWPSTRSYAPASHYSAIARNVMGDKGLSQNFNLFLVGMVSYETV